ncbi:glycosyltransferase family 2 protein [Geomonas paludis]|uniref:Glycosyltransferase family 2 protein n=1 Tax=Geomonas paludis TaxID=2740185 RepID=A0A6V8MW46_9BACT|nr:glycosyltransferase family 2 protein [Geomonas paludis]UPU34412.1 glycosyltransferase family 2 protein [Geomonas paludis]GFO64398.1 putative glycosyltransferase YkoT [Geomonas paludis]
MNHDASRSTTSTVVGIIVPCYNEEAVLVKTVPSLLSLLQRLEQQGDIGEGSFIAFVDDGSTDRTWGLIEGAASAKVKGVKLSRNYGHQKAVLAGIETFYTQADCLVSIDADLQDDLSVIEEMLARFREGFQIVYGVRKERSSDSFFKRFTALGFYRFMELLGVHLVYNHADFRLASRRTLKELVRFREVNLFLRGMFPLLGFRTTCVVYDRQKRTEGESKYPLSKMLSLAWDGVTSFSIKPLRLISAMGFSLFLICLLLCGYALYSYLALGAVPGWSSIVLPMYFLGGIQLLGIGIIGEYIGKIYSEVKQRPRFIVEEVVGGERVD